MYWELRTAPHTDLIAYSDDLDEMLRLALALVEDGFPLKDLYICAEYREGEEGDDADLPPVISGADLLSRARALAAGVHRRSA